MRDFPTIVMLSLLQQLALYCLDFVDFLKCQYTVMISVFSEEMNVIFRE